VIGTSSFTRNFMAKLKKKSARVKKSRPKNFGRSPLPEAPSVGTANWDVIKKDRGWVCVGFDTSLSGIAGAASSLDKVTGEIKGPEFTSYRWGRGTHYFDRLTDCARAHEWVEDLQTKLGVIIEPDDVFIAIEEPWPMGMIKRRMESSALKQQAEISGAFISGLLRYGFKNIFQINNTLWRQLIAAELGITIAPQKFNYTENPFPYAPSGKGSGKWRAKEYGLKFNLPDWPDIIKNNKQGKIPRPETSKARAVQPDDRYDAYAILRWMEAERFQGED
jgi:hypothetical protein